MTVMSLKRVALNLSPLEPSGTVPKAPLQKNVYKKGYHVTEACVLTRSAHPVSIFSRVHSSLQKQSVATVYRMVGL